MSNYLSHIVNVSNALNILLLNPTSELDHNLIKIYIHYIDYIKGNMYKKNPNLYNDILYHMISRCTSISDTENILQKINFFNEGNVFCENISAGGNTESKYNQ